MMKVNFTFWLVPILLGLAMLSCASSTKGQTTKQVKDLDSLQTAYFASGCFWCVEEVFESVNGVEEVVSGYSGGTEINPTYEMVGSGSTSHAEAVKVYYDSSVVSFKTLVDVFFNSHDPTTKNAQGPDKGSQYRSIAFYKNETEEKVIRNSIDSLLANKVFKIITTEVLAFDVFYPAEDYHQNYVKNHPDQPYVRAVSIPRFEAFKKRMPDVLKSQN